MLEQNVIKASQLPLGELFGEPDKSQSLHVGSRIDCALIANVHFSDFAFGIIPSIAVILFSDHNSTVVLNIGPSFQSTVSICDSDIY